MTHVAHAQRYCPHHPGEPVSAEDCLNKIDDLLATVEHHWQCDCGRWFVLRPDTSKRAKVECSCGQRREFNLA